MAFSRVGYSCDCSCRNVCLWGRHFDIHHGERVDALGRAGSFSIFKQEQENIQTQVLLESNLTQFRLLKRDDFLRLKELAFEHYFHSCGLKVLYAMVKLRENLHDYPLPLNKLEEVARLTIEVVGLTEIMGRLSDKGGGCPPKDEIVTPFSKALVEEGLLRRLL